jgi:low affinity Fe/Cu permease
MAKLSSGVLLAGFLIVAMASFLPTRHCYPDTYYKYVDKDGAACFTDTEQTIPGEYQKKAIKMTDEIEYGNKKLKDAQKKADNQDSLLKEEMPSEEKKKGAFTAIMNSAFFGPVVAIAVFFSLFIVTGKIARSLGHQQIMSVLRIVLTVGILVFLLRAQVEKMADIFLSLKRDVDDIAERADERVKKAEETTKDLLVPVDAGVRPK